MTEVYMMLWENEELSTKGKWRGWENALPSAIQQIVCEKQTCTTYFVHAMGFNLSFDVTCTVWVFISAGHQTCWTWLIGLISVLSLTLYWKQGFTTMLCKIFDATGQINVKKKIKPYNLTWLSCTDRKVSTFAAEFISKPRNSHSKVFHSVCSCTSRFKKKGISTN